MISPFFVLATIVFGMSFYAANAGWPASLLSRVNADGSNFWYSASPYRSTTLLVCLLWLARSGELRRKAQSKTQAAVENGISLPPLVRAGLDALNFGFAVFDGDLKLIISNKAFRTLRGYPGRLCVPGTGLVELYRFNANRGDYGPGDRRKQIDLRIAKARKRRARTLEYMLPTDRLLNIRYSPLNHGGLLISYGDVTKRKRAEEALKESQERYASAMAGANEGMWDWIADSDEIVVSESYKKLVGLDLPGDRLKLADWLSMIHPDDLPIRNAARRAHFEGRTDQYESEYRVKCEDGTYRWVRDRAKSQKDRRGKVIRMVGSLNDIHQRKLAEFELIGANKQIREQKETLEALSVQLSKYLSPQIYASIFKGTQTAEIASRRKKLTVFFTDIVDFTEIAEGIESEELAGLLNRYLTEMSKIALACGATIDKYIGDAIMGFFGDPETSGIKADAVACVLMAIAMQERMNELQRVWHDQGIERPFNMRVGINTGYCTVGNFGSQHRMDYTIIGNEVNLAARLQSRAGAGEILIAHETFSLVKDKIGVEEVEHVTMKGISRPVKCYRVIGRLKDLEAKGRIIRKYDDGIRIYLDLFRADKTDVVRTLKRILKQID